MTTSPKTRERNEPAQDRKKRATPIDQDRCDEDETGENGPGVIASFVSRIRHRKHERRHRGKNQQRPKRDPRQQSASEHRRGRRRSICFVHRFRFRKAVDARRWILPNAIMTLPRPLWNECREEMQTRQVASLCALRLLMILRAGTGNRSIGLGGWPLCVQKSRFPLPSTKPGRHR